MIRLRIATASTIDAFVTEAARYFFDGSVDAVRESLGAFDPEETVFVLADEGADARPVATATIRWRSDYPPFRVEDIPLIQNIEVRADLRGMGMGSLVMDALERLVGERSSTVGICVGLFDAYGPAQKLYARRGFVPDGRGACDGHEPLRRGATITLDGNHLLWLVKTLK